MAKKTTEGRVFEFLTPEEIDEIIKAKLNHHTTKGGTFGNKPGSKLWDEGTLMLRRSVILQLLGQGLSRTRLCEELCARWGCCLVTAVSYVKDAMKYLMEDADAYKESVRVDMLHRLQTLAEDALAHNDRKSALSAYDQISKINGLYTTKVEADVKTDITFDFQ